LEALKGEIDELGIYGFFLNYCQLMLSHTSVLLSKLFLVLSSKVYQFSFYSFFKTMTALCSCIGLISIYFFSHDVLVLTLPAWQRLFSMNVSIHIHVFLRCAKKGTGGQILKY
jgi:hypothetical protein